MRLVKLSEEAYEATKHEKDAYTHGAYQRAALEIKASLNAPIDLPGLVKVAYDAKTDRYTATFSSSEKTAILKVTNDVACFLAEHLKTPGSWQGRLVGGVLVDVYVISV